MYWNFNISKYLETPFYLVEKDVFVTYGSLVSQKILPEIKTWSLCCLIYLRLLVFLLSMVLKKKCEKFEPKSGQTLPVMMSKILGNLKVFPLKERTLSVIDKGSFRFRICKRETLEKRSLELGFFGKQMVLSNSCANRSRGGTGCQVPSIICICISKMTIHFKV